MPWGDRVPEATALAHTGLTVSDLDRSIAFYRDALGFDVVMQQEKRGGYLGAIVGYLDAHVRMAHLALPGSDHRIELFEYLEPRSAVRTTEPRATWLEITSTARGVSAPPLFIRAIRPSLSRPSLALREIKHQPDDHADEKHGADRPADPGAPILGPVVAVHIRRREMVPRPVRGAVDRRAAAAISLTRHALQDAP